LSGDMMHTVGFTKNQTFYYTRRVTPKRVTS